METCARILSTSAACRIAALCAGVLVTAAPQLHAGVNVWTSHGPTGVVVRALACDRATPGTRYAGVLGGVLKSTDAGATWNATQLTNLSVSALAIDPLTPSTLYAGTESYDAAIGDIIFKSTDAGATWTASEVAATRSSASTASAGDFIEVSALAIDPSRSDTIYAGVTPHGVLKSADAGLTWNATELINTIVFALAIDPSMPSTLYAVTLGGVFKSTDEGTSWSRVDTGLVDTEVRALAIDPRAASTLYAGTDRGVFKSTDAGVSWGAMNRGLTNIDVHALAIDPIMPSILYAGTNGGGVFSIQQVPGCMGDCRSDGAVTVDDLVAGVAIALGKRPIDACPSFDAAQDHRATIDELIAAVKNALNGCRIAGVSGTLFVTDARANKVHSIDAASGEILASADTGEHPIGVEKANGKVYVANESPGSISVFDAATLSPLIVIPACAQAHHTAASPDGTRFYAACHSTNKVAVVDTETDALIGLLTSGMPGAVTHQPWPMRDGQRLWAANQASNDVTEIDLQTGAILRTFPLGTFPIEIVVSADATRAYVSAPSQNKIMVFDLETDQLVAQPTVTGADNLMLSGDGRTLLASGARSGTLTAASILDTGTLTSVEVILPGTGASHTDLTPDGKFGFVSLVGPPHGVAVLDMARTAVHAVYPIPDAVAPHGVRYAPGPR